MANDYIQDGGHGGIDGGASFNGHIEKIYSLEAAAYVNRRLIALGIKSTMTRSSDVYLDSVPRTNIVKRSGAKVCLSHHFNAGGGNGTETIHSIYSDGKLAALIARSIAAAGVKFRRVFSRKGSSGDYYYMHRMTGNVQTVIVEYEFLDGPHNAKLKDKAFRERLYEATVKAVCEYEKIAYKDPNVKPAAPTAPKKEEVDEMTKYMDEILPKTQREDAEKLFVQAFKDDYFHDNHGPKTKNMTRREFEDLKTSLEIREKLGIKVDRDKDN